MLQADKPPKDETEEERMLRLEMEALAAEQKAQMQAVSDVTFLPAMLCSNAHAA